MAEKIKEAHLGTGLDSEVKEYKFISLEGLPDVDTNFSVSEYEIKNLEGKIRTEKESVQPIIRKERSYAKDNLFEISDVVQKHRGIKEQEERDFQELVDKKVAEKFMEVKEQAYSEGFNKGRDEGFNQARLEMLEKAEGDIEKVVQILDVVSKRSQEILIEQKQDCYDLVKTLSKWVILRELKEDGDYINRLIEKILLELGTRENLTFHIHPDIFDTMPEIIDHIEKKMGPLVNSRIEVSEKNCDSGIRVESEMGILDGTLETQLEIIDKFFEKVDPHE